MKYQIRDAGKYGYFSQIPHLIDDLNLSPHAVRLYIHLKRVAGESGSSYQNTSTLAKACNMSAGMVSKAKKELAEHTPPLITIALKDNPQGGMKYHEITITDIWAENHERYSSSQYEQQVHNMNVTSSQYETKNTTVKNTPIKNIKKRAKARDTRLDHPAVIAYREIVHLHVPISWRQDVVDTVTDIDKWKEVVKSWEGKNYRKGNVEAMLDVYQNGWKQNNRSKQSDNQRLPQGV